MEIQTDNQIRPNSGRPKIENRKDRNHTEEEGPSKQNKRISTEEICR